MISHTVLKPSQGHGSDVGIGTVEFHCSDYADNTAIHSGIKPYFPKARIPGVVYFSSLSFKRTKGKQQILLLTLMSPAIGKNLLPYKILDNFWTGYRMWEGWSRKQR